MFRIYNARLAGRPREPEIPPRRQFGQIVLDVPAWLMHGAAVPQPRVGLADLP